MTHEVFTGVTRGVHRCDSGAVHWVTREMFLGVTREVHRCDSGGSQV